MTAGLVVGTDDRYRWVALSNTTLAVFMSALDGSIVLIALLRGGCDVQVETDRRVA